MDFRPIEAEDIKYAFAGYRAGALVGLGEPFTNPGMDAATFKQTFEQFVPRNYDACWSLFAMTAKGFVPVGLVFGVWERLSPYMLVAGVSFFPWATRRNIIEAMVGFLQGVRKETALMLYARPEHKGLYEVCCAHGVLRRIGTSMITFPGTSAAVYETRT